MNHKTAGNAPARRSRRIEFLRVGLLVAAIAVTWCVLNNRTSVWKWNVPLSYGGDGLSAIACIKSASEGHFFPAMPKYNPSLGAPFTANWNDFPTTESTPIFFMGCLARMFGLFAGCNLAELIGEILAGVSFYLTCRWLRYGWEWAFAGAVIFTFSTYAFFRGLGHITLGYYWHIPLCILVCGWLASRRGLDFKDKRFWFALAVGFVTGIQNPYYTNLFLQFTGFAFLAQLVRRSPRKKLLAPLAVGAAAVSGFVLMNLSTLYYEVVNGRNRVVMMRTYGFLEAYALKPVELIIPPASHSIPWMSKLGQDYMSKIPVPTEGCYSSYVGVIGICALLWLLWSTISNLFSRPPRPVPGRMLEVTWVLAYSIVGGWNGLLGVLGMQLFRATNRFSIWILALLILFLVERLSKISRAWPAAVRAGLALLLCAVAIVDQVPKIPDQASLKTMKSIVDSDRGIVSKLTSVLPAGSMVFQLPVADFPEALSIFHMTDYEHLRPYFYSDQLRYSYGNDKGREYDTWQHETGDLTPAEMIARLEACGFGAIWINRQGYADSGKALIDGLRAAGLKRSILSARGDILCMILNPSPHPVLPNPLFKFGSGWYFPERDPVDGTERHYSAGDAKMDFLNLAPAAIPTNLSFDVSSPVPRKLTVTNGAAVILDTDVGPESKNIHGVVFDVQPGRSRLIFKTDIPAAPVAGAPDGRAVGVMLKNFSAQPQAAQ